MQFCKRSYQLAIASIALFACLLCFPAIAFAYEDDIQKPELQKTGLAVEPEESESGAPEFGESNNLAGTALNPEEAGRLEESESQVEENPDFESTGNEAAGALIAASPAALRLASNAKGSQAETVADGVYTLVSATGEAKCLDVPGGSTDSGVGLQIYSQNVTPAQRWHIYSLDGGLYEIVNVGSGKALDVANAIAADGTSVQQYDRNSTAAQKWRIISADSGMFKIVSALSDSYVLDVSGGSSENGAKVQIWTDNGTNAQRWSLISAKIIDDGFYAIKNSGSGKALDVSGASLDNSANVQQYAPNGTIAQTFHFSYSTSDGYYTITNLGSGKVLDVAGGSSLCGANVQQYIPNGTRAQKWAAIMNSNGTITLLSAISGMALDVSGASASDGANVQSWTPNGTCAQEWALSVVSDWLLEGACSIYVAVNTSNAVDVSSGSTATGANIQAYASNSTNAQRFFLRSVGNGYYTIQNPISGKYLNVSSKSSGGNVVLGTTQQQFKPVFGVGGIVFQLRENSSLVLDVSGASTASGANLQIYTSNGTAAQRFVVRSTDILADGAYSIRYAANDGYVLDVPGASTEDAIQLQLYQGNGTSAQRFSFTRVATNTYQITAECSGKALQVVKTGNDAYQLQQRTKNNSSEQKWIVYVSEEGFIQFTPQSNTSLRIDLTSAHVEDCNPICVYVANGTAAQNWIVVPSKESITYDILGLTLRRMAELQKSEGNNSSLTVSQLMDLLNPNNLDKTQFLDLRTTTNVTASELDAFITSTSKGQSGMLKGLGSVFVSASRQYGLNEVYLLAHAILESGWGTSTLAQGYYYSGGTIDGTYYPAGTYYNFYGIGAYDSSPLSGGRKMAIINGWNSPSKAVTGAAQWIASHYVYSGSYAQPTLYAMKWDYARTNSTGERGWHQYATGTSWPDSIARLINQCYARVGGNLNQVYIIPKYQ